MVGTNTELWTAPDLAARGKTYTKVFFKLIILIIRTSIDSEKPMMKMLNFVNLLYFFRPFATRFYNHSGQ
jgi:hypothetical protein